MRILWLTNVPLQEASVLLKLGSKYSGGWLEASSEQIIEKDGTELFVLFPVDARTYNRSNKIEYCGERIKFLMFPSSKNKEIRENTVSQFFMSTIGRLQPDLVHIFGTELPHSLMMANVCNSTGTKFVVSLQGIVSIISKVIRSDLPDSVVKGFTFRNLFRRDSVIRLEKLYSKLGKNEWATLQRSKYVIGRTTFDRAFVSQVNPEANYYHCNESMRASFYKYQWSLENCERYSIFMSQGHYPIKGLHYAIEAMPLILKEFPNSKLYVAGKNIAGNKTIKEKLLATRYGRYIANLIRKLNLEKKVVFTGPLEEEKMVLRLKSSHVFICPSSIENSPNSLGEAMTVGVPCVASYVGGIPDLIEHKREGFLYQANLPHMLAHYVCTLFENRDLSLEFSKRSRERALRMYSQDDNGDRLLEIYRAIVSNC